MNIVDGTASTTRPPSILKTAQVTCSLKYKINDQDYGSYHGSNSPFHGELAVVVPVVPVGLPVE